MEGLPSQSLFYYFKETLHFSPEKIMIISSIITFAWLIKPPIGYIIDNFFDKKRWIFISLALDIILVLLLGLMYMPIFVLVCILLLNSANAAFRDVAVDGIMCVEGKKYNATGRIQSIQWISISVAGMLTGVGGGYIAQRWSYRAAFLLLVPVYIMVGIIAHFYREHEGSYGKCHSTFLTDLKKIFADKRMVIVGSFIFLYKYSPSFGTPLFYIQRDVFKWGRIWIGFLGTIGTIFGIFGSLIYYKMSQKINIKKWLLFSVFVGAATTVSYLYYTPTTAVIYEVIYNFMGMFIFLMVMDFMARNSVSGLEATSFALLCSVSNLAMVASNLTGAYLLPVVGLKWLIVISALTSFLCLPLIKKIK
ncbi:MAG: MFS transporter [Candidatus Omnitrophica bacterium]|nr:MFS transporter [Candidatus Omnitrophota bacterium]